MLALETLITLNTPCSVVAGFALLINDLHAIDAALGIDQLEVIRIAVGPGHTVGCKRAGAVRQAGKELLFGLRLGGGLGLRRGHRGQCSQRNKGHK